MFNVASMTTILENEPMGSATAPTDVLTTAVSLPPEPKTEQSSLNIQSRFETIWTKLEVPLDQKLDMVIKYCGGSFAGKLKQVDSTSTFHGHCIILSFDFIVQALTLWEDAVYLITKRERLLPDLLEMEIQHCDPAYHYQFSMKVIVLSK